MEASKSEGNTLKIQYLGAVPGATKTESNKKKHKRKEKKLYKQAGISIKLVQ